MAKGSFYVALVACLLVSSNAQIGNLFGGLTGGLSGSASGSTNVNVGGSTGGSAGGSAGANVGANAGGSLGLGGSGGGLLGGVLGGGSGGGLLGGLLGGGSGGGLLGGVLGGGSGGGLLGGVLGGGSGGGLLGGLLGGGGANGGAGGLLAPVTGLLGPVTSILGGSNGSGGVLGVLAGANGTGLLDNVLKPVSGIVGAVTNIVATVPNTVSTTLTGLTSSLNGVANGLTNSLNPLLGNLPIIGGLAKPLTGTAAQLLGTVTDVLGTSIKTLDGGVKAVVGVAESLSKAVDINMLSDILQKTLDSVGAPLDAVTNVMDSITNTLTATNASQGLLGILGPNLQALSSVTQLLSGTVGAGKCVVSSAVSTIRGTVLSGVSEIIKCANPVKNNVSKLAIEAANIAGNTFSAGSGALLNAKPCLNNISISGNIGGIVPCVVNPATTLISSLSNELSGGTKVISEALQSVPGVALCVQNILSDRVSKANKLVQDVTKCANSLGVNPVLPTLPGISDVGAIVDKAVALVTKTINEALGPNNPVNKVLAALEQLKGVTNAINPTTITNTVSSALQTIQDAITAASKNIGSNPLSQSCVNNAQKSLNDLVTKTANGVVSCTVSIAEKAASVITQVAAIDVGLKTELAAAAANAVSKCTGKLLSGNDALQKCFDSVLVELENYIKSQLDKANSALNTVNALIADASKCLSGGVNTANGVGQTILDTLKGCLGGQGVVEVPVTVKPEDITAAVKAGLELIKKAANDLAGAASLISSISVNVQGSVDFIATVDKTTVETIIKGSVEGSLNAVLQVEEMLKDNTNPAVKQCINNAKNNLLSIESAGVASALNCVEQNKQKAAALANMIAQFDAAVKDAISKAEVNAQQQCSVPVGVAATQKCFVEAQVKLNLDVTQAVERVQKAADEVQVVVNEVINCVNGGSEAILKQVDVQLGQFQSCLASQGINVSITRA